MGRDKVLGLSLAILVVGFAGAFCFRNEEFVENGLKLARAKILDEGIAQRPGPKPYVLDSKPNAAPPAKPTVTLEGIEAIEPEPPKTAQQSPRDRSSKTFDPDTRINPNDSDTSPVDEFVSARARRSMPEPVPTTAGPSAAATRSTLTQSSPWRGSSTASADKPIELTIRPATTAFSPPDSLLDEAANWPHAPDMRDGCPAMTGPEHSETTRSLASPRLAGSIAYTVRRGDTLTKIALHFFGDSNRYREIFDANRDQLQTLNARLKVGMTLVIPGDRPRAKRAGNSTTSRTRASRTGNPASTPPRTGAVTARPVAQTREVTIRPRSDKNRSTTPSRDNSPSGDNSQQSTGTLRFVPVQRGPFFRRGDANSSDRPGRDLSQRPPAARGQSTSDRDGAANADGSTSDRTRSTTTPKPRSDDSSS